MTTTSTSVWTTSNSSESEIISDVDESDGWISSSTPRIVFLSVFVSVGFFGNLFLIITVCHSRKFRSITFFIFMINLAVINICECVLNMSVLLASSIINEWKFGELACRLSSFCLNLICIETLLSLLVTTADRLVAICYKEQYEHVISTQRIAILITVTWVQSFSFSVPISIGVVPTGVNTYIVYCAISKGSSVVYNIFSVVLCFLVPLVLIVLFFIKIIRTCYRDRFHIRNIISQHNYNEDSAEEPRIKKELRNLNLTTTICIAWLILEGPHVVTRYISQFQSTSELGENEKKNLKYVWYVDLVLLWLRFSYVMALPISSFIWSKDLWKSFKDIILCRKNNSVVDESFKKSDIDSLKLEKKIREERIKDREAIISARELREQRVFQVPVLFATSHGVHIQTSDKSGSSDDEEDADIETDKSRTTIGGPLKGKKCDVVGLRDNLHHMEEDTSDYDSGNEQDPFSVSHPISVKQINEKVLLTNGKRSLSEPEVRDTVRKIDGHNCRSVCSTSEGDSGLDLSTSTFNKTPKRKQMFHVPSDKLLLHNTNDQLQTEIMDSVLTPTTAKEPTLNVDIKCINEYADFPNGNNIDIVSEESNEQNVVVENDKKGGGLAFPTNRLTEKSLTSVTDSPLPRRKKKRRKDKNFDTQSITSVTSITGIPPRPPARLAPIAVLNNLVAKPLCSVPARPGSSCSSQMSFTDSIIDGRQSVLSVEGVTDISKTESVSFDNMSAVPLQRNKKGGKFKQNLVQETFSTNLLNENDILKLDCKREIRSVPEEILTPSDCNIDDRTISMQKLYSAENLQTTKSGIVNTGFDDSRADETDNEIMPNETKVRNDEARRKRREKSLLAKEKLSQSTLLSDGRGYQRLVPETP